MGSYVFSKYVAGMLPGVFFQKARTVYANTVGIEHCFAASVVQVAMYQELAKEIIRYRLRSAISHRLLPLSSVRRVYQSNVNLGAVDFPMDIGLAI